MRRGWGAAVAVLLLAGCGAPAGPSVGAAPAGEPGEQLATCAAGTETGAGPLAEGERPVAAVRCDERNELVPGDGEWRFRVTERATGIDALVAALRLESEPATDGVCTTELQLPRVVVLEIGGRPQAVSTPRTACHQPLPESSRRGRR